MSPARLQEAVRPKSAASSQYSDRQHSFCSSEMKRHGTGSGSRHPNSYPGALSDTAQLGNSEHSAISSDEFSGNFSIDEYSLPMSDSDNQCGLHDKASLTERYMRISSDENDGGRWQSEAEPHPQKRTVEIKLCIEKEYVHVINIDHSHLAEELEKRNLILATLRSNVDLNFGDSTVKSNSTSASEHATEKRTPMTAVRSSTRKILTGESIRKLFRIMSPASRRHHTADLHSSGSSVSGDTLTGSKSSLNIDGEPPSNASHGAELTKHIICTDSIIAQDREPPSGSSA